MRYLSDEYSLYCTLSLIAYEVHSCPLILYKNHLIIPHNLEAARAQNHNLFCMWFHQCLATNSCLVHQCLVSSVFHSINTSFQRLLSALPPTFCANAPYITLCYNMHEGCVNTTNAWITWMLWTTLIIRMNALLYLEMLR